MKKKITLFLAGGLLFFVAQAQAVQSLPYLQDFSSDPGWATNNAANFSRDGSSGTYSAKSITYSNEYSVIETNYSAGSIRIEYDIKVTNRDSNGETIFGLFGPAYTSFQTSPYDQPCLYVSLGGSENKFQLVGITNSGNQYAVSSALNAVELNKWYRVYLFYDALRQKIAVRIKDKANLDSWVWGAELDIAGTFPANMNYLGFSMVGEWPGSPAMQEAYIDNLKLTLTGAISGRVTAENGNPINNVYIDTSVWGNQWQHYETAWNRTQADGTYYIPCLEPADYRLQATSAPGYGHLYYNNTEDFGQATPVNVQTGEETRDINFTLPFAGELSGSVYEPDGTTPVPYQNISIRKADGLHYDFGARTDEFGFYRFYVAYGNYKINTNNWENDTNFQAEYYNNRSTFEAADVVSVSPGYDATDINFTLDYGASLTGVVLDERLNRLPQIMTTAHNQNSTRTFSNILGKFFLRGRPEEQTEVLAQPEPSLGYVWSGSDPGDDLDINLNENSKNHPLICLDGALATGYIKDASGKPVTGGEFWAGSKNLDAWDRIDSNGRYQIRLPLGRQRINFENEDLGYSALPIEVTVTDTATEITLPDAIAYDALSGASLSGQVINSAGFSKQGAYGVAVFEAGKIIDAEAVYGLGPVAYTELNTAGPYTFPALPPGSNYLVSLLVTNWDSFPEYVSVRDFRDYVNVPITDIDLTYPSEGGTIIGKVTDSGNKPVVGAYLVFNRQSDNQFLGFGITNKDGDFKLYNFPPAACNVTATHFRYANTTATATITEGQETNLGILILSSADEQAIRNGYAQVQAYFAAENIDALMETYADTYLHQGETKASLRPHLGDLFNYCHDISLNFELKYIQLVGERAIVKVDFGYSAIRDSDNKPTRQGWKDELQYFRKESGIWKLSGDEELFAIDNSVQVNYGENGNYELNFSLGSDSVNIASVTVSGPGISATPLLYADGRYYEKVNLGTQPPTIGAEYTFTITDTNSAIYTRKCAVTNIVNKTTLLISPINGALVSGTLLFKWQPVPIAYGYTIKLFKGNPASYPEVWSYKVYGKNNAQVAFDDDGNAQEPLQNNQVYSWSISTLDQDFNSAATDFGSFVYYGPVPPSPADFDRDGDVDWGDFAVFVASWLKRTGEPGYNPDCDFNHDGIVNFIDYATFANAWNPRPPAGLGAGAVSYSQINLSWQDNAHGENGFKIERKTGVEGTYAQIAAVGQNVTTYSDIGLTAEQTYDYRVRSYGTTFGPTTSGYSNQASATTPPNHPPILSSIGNKTINEKKLLEFTLLASDPDKDKLTYNAKTLPAGATFDSLSGKFSWTPGYNQAGKYKVTFTVSDGQLTDSETIIIEVYGKPFLSYSYPRSGGPGTYLWIIGKDFGSRNSFSRVEFSGPGQSRQIQIDAQIIRWSNHYIICRAPEIKPGIYQVRVINQAGESRFQVFIVRPRHQK